MYVQPSSFSELWRKAAKAGAGSLEWLSLRPASSLFFLAGSPPSSTIQVRLLTNFTKIAVFVLMPPLSTIHVGFSHQFHNYAFASIVYYIQVCRIVKIAHFHHSHIYQSGNV